MDGQPVSFDYVAKVGYGRSYMSNRTIDQSGIPTPPLAARAKAPVYQSSENDAPAVVSLQVSDATGVSVRALSYKLPVARQALASILDRLDLL